MDETSAFRQYLPDLSQPRFANMKKQDAHVYANEFKQGGNPPWLHALYMVWLELLKEPFRGVTNDGRVRPGLFSVQDEGVPIDSIVQAANSFTALLSDDQKKGLMYHVDSPEWRTWSNPEFLLSSKGLRLDELDSQPRDAVLAILKASLSPEGYEKAVSAMRINHFLGELVESPAVMNEHSYNFVLFGEPSTTRPWGYSFYGHHLCLNIFFYRTQIIISPWFTGAEPNRINSGPHNGTRILHIEEAVGLQLMQSLTTGQQARTQTYKKMRDENMPPGRWNHDDQRHLCGAYRDNRVVPYEGIVVGDLKPAQQQLVTEILIQYLLYLPHTAREKRLELCARHYGEMYFSWIGGYADEDPFYYRLQSPVILVEFDHHSGVFLTNKEPAKFHIHTLLRTPNGGDYGHALWPLVEPIKQEWCWDGERD